MARRGSYVSTPNVIGVVTVCRYSPGRSGPPKEVIIDAERILWAVVSKPRRGVKRNVLALLPSEELGEALRLAEKWNIQEGKEVFYVAEVMDA